MITRRIFVAGAALGVAGSAVAQHAGQDPLYSGLRDPKLTDVPQETVAQQRSYDSPVPKADDPGRWMARAPLPLPRSEMAWATALDGKMHMIGGYGAQRVDRNYHHVYDPTADKWLTAPELPRGANHVGVVVLDGKLYAIGGHTDQNRKPDNLCFVFDGTEWHKIAPLPKACGAIGCAALDGSIHAIGGAIGDTFPTKKSVDWHLAYDPKADRWSQRRPMPTGRDHTGTLTADGHIHVIGGRVDSFHTNSNLHHAYDAREDKWQRRAPLPTARSGHGAVLYRGKIFVMGGEGTNRVYGQNEAYDLKADTWMAYAPMTTPRHGLGAVAIGDFIYVAGGGPVMGGGIQSAVHEAFTLS